MQMNHFLSSTLGPNLSLVSPPDFPLELFQSLSIPCDKYPNMRERAGIPSTV